MFSFFYIERLFSLQSGRIRVCLLTRPACGRGCGLCFTLNLQKVFMSVTDAQVLIEKIDFANDSLASDIFHRNQLEFSVSQF